MLYWLRKRKVIHAVCTMGGHYQDQSPGLLPAGRRYTGEHVVQTQSVARFKAFFFISATMGLVRADTMVAYVDKRLTSAEVDNLARIITWQVRHYKIGVIEYYLRTDPDWGPYTAAL